MRKRYPIDKKEQERRAKLIAPLFQYLKSEQGFLDDIEIIRVKYGISKTKTGTHNIPIHLLNQKYWKRDISSVATVKHYWPDLQKLWEEFHKDIESIALKYRLKNFLDLLKDFVLQNRFGDALLHHRLQLGEEGHTITLNRNIKKKDFDNIWLEIEKFNKEYPIRKSRVRRYSNEVIEKYKNTEQMEKKYLADQVGLRLLMKKELFGSLTPKEELEIQSWDKSKRSRLTKLSRGFFSLVQDLDEADS